MHAESHSSHGAMPVRVYVSVFLALMVLTAITVLVAHVDLGRGNIVVALAVAVTKAALVVTYFMHLRFGLRMTRVILIAGIMGVVLMMSFTFDDILTRTTQTYLPFIGALDGVRPPGAPVPPAPPME